jgi:hypothetical protein
VVLGTFSANGSLGRSKHSISSNSSVAVMMADIDIAFQWPSNGP